MRRRLYGIAVLLAGVWAAPLAAQAPTGAIRGRVTDQETQRPLQGASITVGSRATVTNGEGRYTLAGLPAGTDTIKVRMIGYTPLAQAVEVIAGETVDANLVLTAQAVNLSEMVVIGYGEQQAGNITGAVTNVTSEEFNTGRIITPTELIQNKVAGVQVVDNNEPGGGKSIRVRGPTSVTAGNEPLIVVDGVPVGAGSGSGLSLGRDGLNFLNSNDIESMTVLRDASAAAIYGTNAANGVIIITTKRGKGKPKLEYSGTVSASAVTRLPSMLNATQFRAAVTQYAPQNVSQLLSSSTNWFDQVDRTGYGQEHNFAISGSGESNDYRLSFNYLDQKGIIEATTAQRLAIGVSYNQRLLNDKLKLQINVRGSRNKDNFTPGGVLSNAAQMGPTQPVKDPTSVTGYYNWPGNQLTSADNPAEVLALDRDQAQTFRGIGNIHSEYSLPYIAGLTANMNLGFDASRGSRTFFSPSVAHAQSKTGTDGTYSSRNPNELNQLFDFYLSYAVPRKVGPGLLDLTAGYSYSQARSEFPDVLATGLATDLLGTDGIPSADFVTSRQFVQRSKLISFFGRVNYNVDDRYLAAFTIRRDKSSRFGPAHAAATFPSVALAWRASEESFLKDRFGLSDLKLRATWAKTGNQAIPNELQWSTFFPGDAQVEYSFGDTLFTTIRPNAVDPNIKWEATRTYNLGLDFGFKNQRYTGSFDWYDKYTTDLIFPYNVPGFTVPGDQVITNIGSMRNRGIEFSLSAKILQGGANGLNWTADLTASHNKNTLLTINPLAGGLQQIFTGGIAGGVGSLIQELTPGQPINSFYVYQHKMENGKPIYKDTNGDNVINDQDLYVDRNGDNIINQLDRRPFHDPAPKWIFGHSSYLTYRHFDFGFTLRAYTGNYVYNNVASNLGTYSEVTRGSPYNLHTSVLKTNFATPQYLSDYYVEKASFLRMDNLTVGYSFDLKGVPARVFGALQNAFTITGYDGVDPTAGTNGIDNNLYPRSRTFTSGLSVQF